MKKENRPPTPSKQGVFYQIHLGKDEGPFLPKDIMLNNSNSLQLLYANAQNKSSKTKLPLLSCGNRNSSDSVAVDGMNNCIELCETELAVFRQTSSSLTSQKAELKRDLVSMEATINNEVNSVVELSLPALKKMLKRVKEISASDKEEQYRLQRELQLMRRDHQRIVLAVKDCESRVSELGRTMGQQLSPKAISRRSSNHSSS